MYIGEGNPSNVSYCQLRARDVGSQQLSRVAPPSCISRLWSKKMSKKREQMSIVFCYPANNQVTFYLENLLKNPKKSKNLLWNEKKSYRIFQSLLNIQGLEMQFLFQMNIILSNPILLLCTRSLLAFKCPFVKRHQNDHFIMLVLCLATHFCFKKYKTS